MALRKITKTVGRYHEGASHDFPRDVWNKIARDAGMKLEEFSEEMTSPSPVAQSMLKGRPVIHKRLGGTQ